MLPLVALLAATSAVASQTGQAPNRRNPGNRPMPFLQLIARRDIPAPPMPVVDPLPLPAGLPTKFVTHQPQIHPDTVVREVRPDGKGHS
ncbi:MAG: hypothetical protein ACOVT5_11070, partial [Armatimonadaceae bacterium]